MKQERARGDSVALVAVSRRPQLEHFPFSICWCPIPGLSWLIPPVGHLGIVTSNGTIHDFAGPYYVNRSPKVMGFGHVTKYIEVDVRDLKAPNATLEQWDSTIEGVSCDFDQKMHNLLCNNCHTHVSEVLNTLEYQGFTQWNTFFLIFYLMYKSKYVSWARFFQTYAGFFVLAIIGLVIYLALHFGR